MQPLTTNMWALTLALNTQNGFGDRLSYEGITRGLYRKSLSPPIPRLLILALS